MTANYFNVLQVRPASGRLLTDADRKQPAAVISHRLWTDMFGQDPAVIGASDADRSSGLHSHRRGGAVIAGTEIDSVDVWLPLDFRRRRGHVQRVADASMSWLQVVGRLAPDASLKSAAVKPA